MAKFNGSYSFRPGYHGARKQSSAININVDFWTCDNGHRNPKYELVDERTSGGFVRRQQVASCKQCASTHQTHDITGAK